MCDHYEKPEVLEHMEARAAEVTGHVPVCSPASAPPAPETTGEPEKTCSKVKSKPGTGIVKRSSDLTVSKPRACASGPVKDARRHALPVKGSGKAGTTGAAEKDTVTAVRKARSVTVDTSKAKTSLEALKLSIRQLKWKEVRNVRTSDVTLIVRKPSSDCSIGQSLASTLYRPRLRWIPGPSLGEVGMHPGRDTVHHAHTHTPSCRAAIWHSQSTYQHVLGMWDETRFRDVG